MEIEIEIRKKLERYFEINLVDDIWKINLIEIETLNEMEKKKQNKGKTL